ncbi:MAG: CDGSH iron-sulfur domain-containing protein [Gallionellaceae bacterium]|nr:CDGSH iron-sulfur domain-containing protein [Gallionellaceae bacterium]MDD5365579.1 CDGSH iron-sulfur domain-containing protein [Gallionellaceae bacterium]
MTDPFIAQRGPYPVDLEPGEYYWCACGHSKTQPFCDGSHEGTGFTPVQMVIAEKSQVYLCGCKYTATPPFCDGSHDLID